MDDLIKQKKEESIEIEEILNQLGNLYSELDEVASQLNLYLAKNKGAKAAAHFYDRDSDDMTNSVEIGFGFEQDRLNRDMAAVRDARKRVKSSGMPLAPTGSYAQAQSVAASLEANNPDPTKEKADIKTPAFYFLALLVSTMIIASAFVTITKPECLALALLHS